MAAPATGQPLVMANTNVMVKTVFEYTPDAVTRIISRYNDVCKYSSAVQSRFDPIGHMFILEGPNRYIEFAFEEFKQILKQFTAEEERKRDNKLVHRSALTQLNVPPIQWIEPAYGSGGNQYSSDSGSTATSTSSWTAPADGGTRNPEIARLEEKPKGNLRVIDYWEPRVSKEEFTRMLKLHTSPSVPESLAVAGKCELYPDWSQRFVKIMAVDKKTLDRTMKKLRSVLDLFKKDFTPEIVHAPVVRCERKFQILFIALSKQGDIARTTLWRKSKDTIYDAMKFYTVRVRYFNKMTKKWENGRLNTEELSPNRKTVRHFDWSEYVYSEIKPSGQLHKFTIAELDDFKESRVLPPSQLLCTYWPDDETAEEVMAEEQRETTVPTKTIRRPRSRSASISSPNEKLNPPTSDAGVTIGPSPGATDGGLVFGARPTAAQEAGPETQTQRKPRVRETVGTPATSAVPATTPGSSTNAANLHSTKSSGGDKSIRELFSSFTIGARPEAPQQEEPAAMTARVPKSRGSRAKASSAASNVTEGKLVDVGDTDTATSEFASRELKRTMEQKQSARSSGHSSRGVEDKVFGVSERLRKDNLQTLTESFLKAFDYARNSQGQIVMDIQFGRMLYHGLTRHVVKEPVMPAEWHDQLRSEEHDIVKFTNVLSILHTDVEFIADLQFHDSDLFERTPSSTRVYYELKCSDNVSKNTLFIVIDAETHETTAHEKGEYYATGNLTMPQHSWDARMCLTNYKPIDPQQNLGVKAIVDTLSARGGSVKPQLIFTTINADFNVQEVLVKREKRYRMTPNSLHNKVPLELVLTEIHDLDPQRKMDGSNMYRANGRDLHGMRNRGRLYYTAGLCPTEVNKKLEENRHLEVGGTTSWTTEDIMNLSIFNLPGTKKEDNLIEALVKTTEMMVSKIDNVGWHNNSRLKFE